MSATEAPTSERVRTPAPSRTLLLSQDREPRRPLDRWSARLLDDLASALERRRLYDLAWGVAVVANQAALVAMYRGTPLIARNLCLSQIRWIDRLGRRARHPEISALALQPWVNLARLDARLSAHDRALDGLHRLAKAVGTYDTGVTSPEATPEPWRRWIADPRAARLATFVSIVDALQTLLRAGRFAEALTLAAHAGPSWPENARAFADESAIVAWCHVGEPARATAVAIRAARQYERWRIVFRLRLAEIAITTGDLTGARRVLQQLLLTVPCLLDSQPATVDHLLVLLRMAECWRDVHEPAIASGIATQVYDEAVARDDEMLQIDCAELLSHVAGAPDVWRTRRQKLVSHTAYARWARHHGTPTASPVANQLHHQLRLALQDSERNVSGGASTAPNPYWCVPTGH